MPSRDLERVQGDERDAIILSVGYGKGPDGRLRYHFGPLNDDGGERRLNVAVTRAKKRMTVVSSLTALDLDPERTTREGLRLLRHYLEYAHSGGANLGDGALERPELNGFEIDVRDSLDRAGVPLIPQWGCSGYFIDFAAKHPTRPGELVLAIECDGATYHSSQSARDRDRLRQDHLENLGWRFHRIWSTDWFRAARRKRSSSHSTPMRRRSERPTRGMTRRRQRTTRPPTRRRHQLTGRFPSLLCGPGSASVSTGWTR
jgi:very-short-patch-repair endonuclease